MLIRNTLVYSYTSSPPPSPLSLSLYICVSIVFSRQLSRTDEDTRSVLETFTCCLFVKPRFTSIQRTFDLPQHRCRHRIPLSLFSLSSLSYAELKTLLSLSSLSFAELKSLLSAQLAQLPPGSSYCSATRLAQLRRAQVHTIRLCVFISLYRTSPSSFSSTTLSLYP